VDQCPLAYSDPCLRCAQFGNCCPSQTIQKLDVLEKELKNLKKLLQKLVSKETDD
jgi:hypothetical protein